MTARHRIVHWTGIVVVALCCLPLVAAAGIRHFGPAACPKCSGKVCQPVAEKVKEEKSGWEIEQKEICIPHITWPWQQCCGPAKCGRVKTINVLKKEEWECERCGYRWEIKSVGTCCPPR
jgi:hypothetical protein